MSSRKYFQNEKERRKWQNPEAILTDIGLRPGFTFVDVGCGEGFFALPAARLVGKKGRVYGLDIDQEAIGRLRCQAANEGLSMVLEIAEAEKTIVCDACADIVFYGIVLHDFKDPVKVLMNATRMLKPHGRLIDLDWKKEPMEAGPPVHIRFNEDQAIHLIELAGFRIDAVETVGPYHYLITATSAAEAE